MSSEKHYLIDRRAKDESARGINPDISSLIIERLNLYPIN